MKENNKKKRRTNLDIGKREKIKEYKERRLKIVKGSKIPFRNKV